MVPIELVYATIEERRREAEAIGRRAALLGERRRPPRERLSWLRGEAHRAGGALRAPLDA